MSIDPKGLRRALGQFATGVAVITTRHGGADVGITINSFTSVSLDPPLVLWCLARTSRSYPAFAATERYVVNVLSASQVEISNRFAFREGTDFPEELAVTRGAGRVALLTGAAARFQCRVTERLDGGDHIVLLGEVTAFDDSDCAALLYHQGQYAVSDPHPGASAAVRPGSASPGFFQSALRPGLEWITERFEHHLEDELSGAGINAKQWRIVNALLTESPQASESIANQTLISGSPLSETLASLESRGLIAQESTTAEARYLLTPRGETLAADLRREIETFESNALGSLATHEADALLRTLKRVAGWIESARENEA